MEITDRRRKTIKLKYLSLRSDGKSNEEIKAILHRLYREYYHEASQLNADELLELYLSSLTNAIDPHTNYIDQGPVVQLKSPGGKIESLDDQERGVDWDGPLLVMVSQMTTSASEVFAGAIQDYGRGLVVGDPKTHGKGTVQKIVDIVPDPFGPEPAKTYGALKLTIKQLYRPGGSSTQLAGVASDVVLPSLTAKLDISESDLDYALPRGVVSETEHQNYEMVDNAIRVKLRKAADERVAKNLEFGQLRLEIETYVKQKADETISLNEVKCRSLRSDLTTEKVREQFLESKAERDQVFYDNFYNRGIIHIARDYVDLLRSRKVLNGQ